MRRIETDSLVRYSILAGMLAGYVLASPFGVTAQRQPPRAAVLAGFGNAFGWIGAQVQGYAVQCRFSGFIGIGSIPNLLNEEGNTAAGAIGLRAFTPGDRHRGLLEISLSTLSNSVTSTSGADAVEKRVGYGPGLAVGYPFIGDSGITALFSAGSGSETRRLIRRALV